MLSVQNLLQKSKSFDLLDAHSEPKTTEGDREFSYGLQLTPIRTRSQELDVMVRFLPLHRDTVAFSVSFLFLC